MPSSTTGSFNFVLRKLRKGKIIFQDVHDEGQEWREERLEV